MTAIVEREDISKLKVEIFKKLLDMSLDRLILTDLRLLELLSKDSETVEKLREKK